MTTFQVKPAPKVDENHVAVPCRKCNGTGKFCRGMLDGRPFSFTGFDCWTCRGSGWFIHKKPRVNNVSAMLAWFRAPGNSPVKFIAEMSELSGNSLYQDGMVTGPTGKQLSLNEFTAHFHELDVTHWEYQTVSKGVQYHYIILND